MLRSRLAHGRKVALAHRDMSKLVPVSLADLADAGVRLRPTDAVTIVRALILQVANGILPGVPSAHVIRLAPSGGITVEGPVVASGRPVPRAAQLLAALLRGSGRPTAEPTPLRRVIARAIQQPSEFSTLQELADALGPFAAQDPSAAIKELTTRWTEAARAMGLQAADPTDNEAEPDGNENEEDDDIGSTGSPSVSDVRRARRDTGLSLEEVSKRSRIPVSMLRQLEWGYLRNWPHGLSRSHAAGEIRARRRPRPSTRARCDVAARQPDTRGYSGRRSGTRTTTATGLHHSCCRAAGDYRDRPGCRARRPGG